MARVGTCARRRTLRTTPGSSRRPRSRVVDRGAAAVEAVLVSAVLLVPLFLGVVNYGQLFWEQQQVALYPPRLDQSVASGYCTTQQIVDRVKSAAADSIYSLNKTTLDGLGITRTGLLDYITATVRNGVSVGADVTVSVKLPTQQVGNVIPIPGNNESYLVRDLNQRLDYVQVSTTGTQCSP